MAVFLSVIILLSITEKIASKRFYEPRLKQAIVFASFHLPTSYCGLIDSKGVQIAPMSDGKAAIAIPDGNLDYTFDIIDCKPRKRIVIKLAQYWKSPIQKKCSIFAEPDPGNNRYLV